VQDLTSGRGTELVFDDNQGFTGKSVDVFIMYLAESELCKQQSIRILILLIV